MIKIVESLARIEGELARDYTRRQVERQGQNEPRGLIGGAQHGAPKKSIRFSRKFTEALPDLLKIRPEPTETEGEVRGCIPPALGKIV